MMQMNHKVVLKVYVTETVHVEKYANETKMLR